MTLQQHIEKLIEEKGYDADNWNFVVSDPELRKFASELSKDYVLVPREPTDAMLLAMNDMFHDSEHELISGIVRDQYKAMLQAQEEGNE